VAGELAHQGPFDAHHGADGVGRALLEDVDVHTASSAARAPDFSAGPAPSTRMSGPAIRPGDPHPRAYARRAVIEPCPTPNPDAMKFPLGYRVAAGFNVRTADEAGGRPFTAAVWAAGGVAAIFAVNDFVTVTRVPGAAWPPIVAAVQQAVADGLLPAATDDAGDDAVAAARQLLRSALEDATAEARDQGTDVPLRRRRGPE
jgi:hypothetical protein